MIMQKKKRKYKMFVVLYNLPLYSSARPCVGKVRAHNV